MKGLDKVAVQRISEVAQNVFTEINELDKPEMKFPMRALSNVRYDKRRGYFEIGRQRKVRSLSVNTVKGFAQSLRMMGLSKE